MCSHAHVQGVANKGDNHIEHSQIYAVFQVPAIDYVYMKDDPDDPDDPETLDKMTLRPLREDVQI